MPTKPQDHKNRTFTWKAPDGTAITIPSMSAIKGGSIRKHRKLEPLDFMFSLIEDSASSEALDQIDDLDRDDMSELFQAWQDDEGVTPGES